MYPNPAQNEVKVVTGSNTSGTVKVYNLAGKEVYTTVIQGFNAHFNTSTLMNGVYMVSINGGSTKKLVIQH